LRRKGIAKQKEARPPKPKSERGEDGQELAFEK